ncbi:MAG: hypothetical protein BAJALOKI1v1_2180005 [Promethearchaeota archaeon]|nr:MAG: hypothetical protein BAJALOKI1v1_2180005 [Candidatus Lokiarchaeota archaeon]
MSDREAVYEKVKLRSEGYYGIICLNCLFNMSSYDDLNKFAEKNNIKLFEGNNTKLDYLKDFLYYYDDLFEHSEAVKKLYGDVPTYMGKMMLEDDIFQQYISKFDFISKKELIDKFADFCADLEINVYDASEISQYHLNLYLTKKTPFLKTEAVFVRTGFELTEQNYEELLELINEASEICTWNVFVTTPYGIARIGFERMVKDMEALNVWLYYINPLHQEIMGITKGGKNKEYDSDKRDSYIEKLPRNPIRAPSQVVNVKISNYYFSESESYKPKNFRMFEIDSKNHPETVTFDVDETSKYTDIFRSIIVIDNFNGMSLVKYSKETESSDDMLVSGFLSAMDNFVSELSAQSSSLNEISYKGFYVQGLSGDLIKIALFLTKPADEILKERLMYFINKFESDFKDKITEFRESGDVSIFRQNKQIVSMIKDILKV